MFWSHFLAIPINIIPGYDLALSIPKVLIFHVKVFHAQLSSYSESSYLLTTILYDIVAWWTLMYTSIESFLQSDLMNTDLVHFGSVGTYKVN